MCRGIRRTGPQGLCYLFRDPRGKPMHGNLMQASLFQLES